MGMPRICSGTTLAPERTATVVSMPSRPSSLAISPAEFPAPTTSTRLPRTSSGRAIRDAVPHLAAEVIEARNLRNARIGDDPAGHHHRVRRQRLAVRAPRATVRSRARAPSPRYHSRSAAQTGGDTRADTRETDRAKRTATSRAESASPADATCACPVCSVSESYSRDQLSATSPRSSTTCSTPRRCSSREVARPAGPAPMTTAGSLRIEN